MAHVLLFFLLCVAIWYVWIKMGPNHSDLIKVKFDYEHNPTAFYGPWAVGGAAAFWLLLFVVGAAVADRQTTVVVLGFIGAVYLLFVLRYAVKRAKQAAFKKHAAPINGQIVGTMTHRTVQGRGLDHRHAAHVYLIVAFVHPQTGENVEYIPAYTVNGSPLHFLKSLKVTVWYQDNAHIWVDGFDRVKALKDNLAFQHTGRVDGNAEGLLREQAYTPALLGKLSNRKG